MGKDKDYQQLQGLIKDFSQWTKDYLEAKSPERANAVNKNLMYLDLTVRQHPEQAEAALYCANAVWHMLFEDARRGARQRNIHQPPPELATKDILISRIDALHKRNPDWLITMIREQVATDTDYTGGAKVIARKTGWYNPTK